ncbi:hypothetical protein ABZ686_22410 [Streptomyces sp. NPDC006992]|uniref:hypothetical protein n=1 Tax=unclassified Streptomyces TaxID=2593676 RepID=UPI0033F704DE
MHLVLEGAEDLRRAAALASWLGRPTVDEVVVRLPWLGTGDRGRSAESVRRLFNDCGCVAGTAAFTVAVSAFLVYRLTIASGVFSWPLFGVTVLLGVAAGVCGKLLGLAWSRRRLRGLLLRLSEARPDA